MLPTLLILPWMIGDGKPLTSGDHTIEIAVEGTIRRAIVHLPAGDGGGHARPGRTARAQFLGPSTHDISANDLMWEFFQKHPRP